MNFCDNLIGLFCGKLEIIDECFEVDICRFDSGELQFSGLAHIPALLKITGLHEEAVDTDSGIKLNHRWFELLFFIKRNGALIFHKVKLKENFRDSPDEYAEKASIIENIFREELEEFAFKQNLQNGGLEKFEIAGENFGSTIPNPNRVACKSTSLF